MLRAVFGILLEVDMPIQIRATYRQHRLFAVLLSISCLGLHLRAQQPDGTQQAPTTVTDAGRPAPASKAKTSKREKKEKRKDSDAPGPPTALCKDGTYSHERPTAGERGKKPCQAHGGVSRYF